MLLKLPDDFIPHDFLDLLEYEKLIKIYSINKGVPKRSSGTVILMEDVEKVLEELIKRFQK